MLLLRSLPLPLFLLLSEALAAPPSNTTTTNLTSTSPFDPFHHLRLSCSISDIPGSSSTPVMTSIPDSNTTTEATTHSATNETTTSIPIPEQTTEPQPPPPPLATQGLPPELMSFEEWKQKQQETMQAEGRLAEIQAEMDRLKLNQAQGSGGSAGNANGAQGGGDSRNNGSRQIGNEEQDSKLKSVDSEKVGPGGQPSSGDTPIQSKQPSNPPPAKPPSPAPHRYNYASPDCSARIHSSSPQTQHASSLLHKSKDRYMLTPCSAKEHWVVIELCDDIRIDAVEIGMFEFFSGVVREVTLSVGGEDDDDDDDDDGEGDFQDGLKEHISEDGTTITTRINTQKGKKEWQQVGSFIGKNVRGIQTFTLSSPTSFHRFLKIDFPSHYGSEYYCPVSSVKVWGMNQMEAFKWESRRSRAKDEEERERAKRQVEEEKRRLAAAAAAEEELKRQKEEEERLRLVEEQEQQEKEKLAAESEVMEEKEILVDQSVGNTTQREKSPEEVQSSTNTNTTSTSSQVISSHSESSATAVAVSASNDTTVTKSITPTSTGQQKLDTAVPVVNATTTHSTPTGTSSVSSVVASSTAVVVVDSSSESAKGSSTASASVSKPSSSSVKAQSSTGTISSSTQSSTTSTSSTSSTTSSTASSSSTTNQSSSSSAQPTPISSSTSSSTTSSSTSSSSSSTYAPRPTITNARADSSESIYAFIIRRLNALEGNSTLAAMYIEEQSKITRGILARLEGSLNDWKVDAMMMQQRLVEEARNQTDTRLNDAIARLEHQRVLIERDRVTMRSQMRLLSDKVTSERRRGAIQLVFTFLLVFLGIITRGRSLEAGLTTMLSQPKRKLTVTETEKEQDVIDLSSPNPASPTNRGLHLTFGKELSRPSVSREAEEPGQQSPLNISSPAPRNRLVSRGNGRRPSTPTTMKVRKFPPRQSSADNSTLSTSLPSSSMSNRSRMSLPPGLHHQAPIKKLARSAHLHTIEADRVRQRLKSEAAFGGGDEKTPTRPIASSSNLLVPGSSLGVAYGDLPSTFDVSPVTSPRVSQGGDSEYEDETEASASEIESETRSPEIRAGEGGVGAGVGLGVTPDSKLWS